MPIAKPVSHSPIVVAAASAHAAGVSASLLCDRVELLGTTEPGRLTVDRLSTDIANITVAARQLTSAVTRVLATLEPGTQPRVVAITEAAFHTRLLLLTPSEPTPGGTDDLSLRSDNTWRPRTGQPARSPAPSARVLREGSRAILHAGGDDSPPSADSSPADVHPPHERRGGFLGRCPDPDPAPPRPGPAAFDSPQPAARAQAG
jgi:hypothetical protein